MFYSTRFLFSDFLLVLLESFGLLASISWPFCPPFLLDNSKNVGFLESISNSKNKN